jgi:predicted DNA-binding protein with PD1-like motif
MHLILHTGDDALESIKAFADRNQMDGASFYAIGAFREATVAYWNWDTKEARRCSPQGRRKR